MDSITIEGTTFVAKAGDGTCVGCDAENDPELCDKILDTNMNSCVRGNDTYVIWINKANIQAQAEVSKAFGHQIPLFPELEAEVTEEEEEAFEVLERQSHRQVGGDHYFNPIQPWDIIRAWDLNYWAGNVVKYVLRAPHKNGREDLEKARHYLDYLIENYDELYRVSD